VTDLWIDLLPVLLAMMVSPARTLAVILLLHTPRNVTTALGYVAGMVSSMLLQGAALGAGMRLIGLTSPSGELTTVVGVLYLLGGVILLAGAFKIATAEGAGGSLASLLDRLERLEPVDAYKVGFGWLLASPKQWVFVLTAVAIIFSAGLRPIGSLANFFVLTLLVQGAYLLIIGAYAVARKPTGRVLDAVFHWIRVHLRATAIGVFAGFGVVFLLKGLSTLG
jgi:hypothetical protein